MDKLNVKSKYGAKYDSLFSKEQFSTVPYVNRGFAIPEDINLGAILFTGLNPSYRKGSKPGSFFYDFEKAKNDQYFKKFWTISEACGLPCAHLDLLGVRETSQKEIGKLAKNHTDFVWENLNLSKKILESIKPEIIVVTDTQARMFLGKERNGDKNSWLGYEFGEMQEDGTFRITNKDSNLTGVPWFFTGMLSGQRALDKGSFERLQWHIHMIASKR